jgi:outer membrane receptor for ferrienterochelin and colicins
MKQRPLMKTLTLAILATLSVPLVSHSHEAHVQKIEVTKKRMDEKALLRDDIVATESVSARDIEKTGAIMLTDALDKRPGVATQTECSICNVRNVLLNNLPGRYTTLLIDGIPIYSAVSSAYGLDSVSLGGIERIDIARGAGASLIAPEALSGVINIVTRRPTKDELLLSQQIGTFGQTQTAIFGARAFDGGALTSYLNHARHKSVDGDGNGVSEYTGYERTLGGVGYFLDDVAGFKVRGRLDLVTEKRGGGALGKEYEAIKADKTGNPFNWSKGINASPDARGWVSQDESGADTLSNGQQGSFYSDGRAGFSEIIFTDRAQLVSSASRRVGGGSMHLALAAAKHEQDSFYENTIYQADQTQYYVAASGKHPLGDTLLTAGVDYRFEDLRSKGGLPDAPNDGIDNYTHRTTGLFVEAYNNFFQGKIETNSSLRVDQNNVYDRIVSPRFNLRWSHDAQLNSRFALGKGFRIPTSFYEQDHGILDTTRIVRQITKPEVSRNASYNLSYAADRLSWSAGVNWNRVDNMALLDSSGIDEITGDPITLFTSAQKPVTVLGEDITVMVQFTPAIHGSLGLEHTRYSFEPGTLAFARPTSRAYFSFDYESGPWSTTTRATWTGSQDLAQFYDYANNQRYNLNGSEKIKRSPQFWTLDLRGEYRINPQWQVYLGADNLLNYQQSDKDSLLWLDASGGIDVTHIWGPTRGRFVYAGLKFSL